MTDDQNAFFVFLSLVFRRNYDALQKAMQQTPVIDTEKKFFEGYAAMTINHVVDFFILLPGSLGSG